MTGRRPLTFLLLAAVAFAAVWTLRETTQNRPDQVPAGTASVIEVSLRTNQGEPDPLDATALWAACVRSTLSPAQQDSAQLAWLGDGRFTGTVEPAVGDHGRKRLEGCLEDLQHDHIKATVAAITTLSTANAGNG